MKIMEAGDYLWEFWPATSFEHYYPGGVTPPHEKMSAWVQDIIEEARGMDIALDPDDLRFALTLEKQDVSEYFDDHPEELSEAIDHTEDNDMTIEDVVDGVRTFAAEMFHQDLTGDVACFILTEKAKDEQMEAQEDQENIERLTQVLRVLCEPYGGEPTDFSDEEKKALLSEVLDDIHWLLKQI